jgi:hypothetical protein
MTKETLLILRQILGQVTLNANADDFAETARLVSTAKQELDAALAEQDQPSA